MKCFKIYLIPFLVLFNCSQNDAAENVRNTVEYAIGITSRECNEIIWEFNNVKVNGIDNSKKMSAMLNDARNTFNLSKQMIVDLNDIDSDINLKKSALEYFDHSNNYLNSFIKPMSLLTFDELHNDKDLQKKMYDANIEMMNATELINKTIEEFCQEHKLSKELPEFDKSKFEKQRKEAEEALGL